MHGADAPRETVCPRSGHDNSRLMNRDMTLTEGNTLLEGKYLIGRVLVKGGIGITYLGLDTGHGVRVAIKEYFPQSLCSTRIPVPIPISVPSMP